MEFIEVDSIEEFNYSGDVYDIGVEVDHNYTINDYTVHNSAAGSLINYVLDLTEVDPLKHNLLFERFLDIARYDPVDIDTDFTPASRDHVVDYIIKKYGVEYTSSIGTYGVIKPKSAILDVARTFGIPAQETMQVTKYLIGSEEDDVTLQELENQNTKLKQYLDKYEKQGYDLRYYIRGILGSIRQPSVHAAGVLISSEKLSENVAIIKAKKRDITAWQEGGLGRELSDLGYYKFDILGLNNLQVLDDALHLIKQRRGEEINWDNIDYDEEFVYENVVHNNDNFGVFQFESPFVQKIIKDVQPDNFEQLAAISALLRPGPLRMGMDKEFARRKNGIADEEGHVWSEQDIPEPIRDILSPTMGIFCVEGSSLILTNEGLIPIEKIVDEKLQLDVLTLNEKTLEYEWKPITNWFNNNIKDLIELDFGETKIQCTPDHKIFTLNRGWVEAKDLDENDEIVYNNSNIVRKELNKWLKH